MTTAAFAKSRVPQFVALALLLLLHFWVRPLLWDSRIAPDFLLIALVLYAMQSGPGAGAVAGFIVGVAGDALTPAHFGSSMLAHTVVGALAAWGRAVFFADNSLVTAGFVGVAVIVRNLVLLLASGGEGGGVAIAFVTESLPQGFFTAVAALVFLAAFRRLFDVRLDA